LPREPQLKVEKRDGREAQPSLPYLSINGLTMLILYKLHQIFLPLTNYVYV